MLFATVVLTGIVGPLSFAGDQPAAPNPEATSKEATSKEATSKEALEWIDRFARSQVLFHADDVKKLREKVAAMSPEEASAWWEKTAPQRKVLGSPEWKETESWLRQFLSVQAKYSDEEIRLFQAEAAAKAKESPESLEQVLERVRLAREKMIAGSRAAEETRKAQLAANAAYRQEQVRQREAAARQARTPVTSAPANPPAVRRSPPRYNDPLVDSLDVARWSILREFFPRW